MRLYPPHVPRPDSRFSPHQRSSRPSGFGPRADWIDPAARARALTSARGRALAAIASQAARFPDCLPPSGSDPDTKGLDARDAALAHAIYDATMRRWLTLSGLIDHVASQPCHAIEPGLAGVLLGSAAQLMFLDRVPPHAVIDEGVEIAKALARPDAARFANAVLRRIAEARARAVFEQGPWNDDQQSWPLADGRVLRWTEPMLPADPLDRWSMACSLPVPLLTRWRERFGPSDARTLALHTLVDPPTVLRTAHLSTAIPADCPIVQHHVSGHHVFTGTGGELGPLLTSRPDLWVQDAASSEAIAGIASLMTPAIIADPCAGKGTKTAQLAATFPNATIIASDVDAPRFATLSARFAGHQRVRVVRSSELAQALAALGGADLILLDVPCSNTGVLARRSEARYRAAQPAQLDRLVLTQQQIIRDAHAWLAPRRSAQSGAPVQRPSILYSTCSLEAEENRAQVGWMERTLKMKLVAGGSLVMPRGLPGDPPTMYRDGAFWALMAK
jgi:16S rRNA (cytosine967-C5)-methyltransferase